MIFNKKLLIRDKKKRYALITALSFMCLLIGTVGIASSSRYIGLIILISSLIVYFSALILSSSTKDISLIPPSSRSFNSIIYSGSIHSVIKELYELGFDLNAKLGNIYVFKSIAIFSRKQIFVEDREVDCFVYGSYINDSLGMEEANNNDVDNCNS